MVDAKRAALLALVVQNTLLVLTMRYSRTRPGPMYLASTAVVVDEALKATVCVAALLWQWSRSEQRGGAAAFLRREVCERPAETMKMAVVAGLYTLQKNALYVAVSNLDAAVFQLTYQAKNLTTALFTCILLGRTFTRQQLGALVVLTGGVAAIQVDAVHGGSGEAVGDHHERECPREGPAAACPCSPRIAALPAEHHFLGVAAVLVACCTSGFAGVYFEKVLKGSKQVSLFAKNLQLAGFAFCFATIFGLSRDLATIRLHGFFHGFTPLVCCVVVLEACGGLVVATVIKFADNILKTLATSLSIVTSSVLSFWLLDFQISALFCAGAFLVLIAISLYSVPLDNSCGGQEDKGGSGAISAALQQVQRRVAVRRRIRAAVIVLGLGCVGFFLRAAAVRARSDYSRYYPESALN